MSGPEYMRKASRSWQKIALEIDAKLAKDGSDEIIKLLAPLGLCNGIVEAVLREVLSVSTVADLWNCVDDRLISEEGYSDCDDETAACDILTDAGLKGSESRKIARALCFGRSREKLREKIRAEAGIAMPSGSQSGLYDPRFLDTVRDLYDLHMGVENMAPLLYSLVRFIKPSTILEIGAGYTSIFLLQALADNHREMQNYVALQKYGLCTVDGGGRGGSLPWCVENLSEQNQRLCQRGVLYCVDNMAHAYTTAHKVEETADKLCIRQHLRMIKEDAWELDLMPDVGEKMTENSEFLDMLWVDFGAGKRLNEFFAKWWPKLRKGGIAVVHSTVTNEFTRKWLDSMRCREKPGQDSSLSDEEEYNIPCNVILGPEDSDDDQTPLSAAPAADQNHAHMKYETISFYEPHKMFQNSFSIFQKRDEGYSEPILTKYP